MVHLQRGDNHPIRGIDPHNLLVMEIIPLVHPEEVTNIPLNLKEIIPRVVHPHQGQVVTPRVEVHLPNNNKSLVLQLPVDLPRLLQPQILRLVGLPTQVIKSKFIFF